MYTSISSVRREHFPIGRLGIIRAPLGPSNLTDFFLLGFLLEIILGLLLGILPTSDFEVNTMVCCDSSSESLDDDLTEVGLSWLLLISVSYTHLTLPTKRIV